MDPNQRPEKFETKQFQKFEESEKLSFEYFCKKQKNLTKLKDLENPLPRVEINIQFYKTAIK